MARVYGNNAARGYGRTHWKLRAYWKPHVDAGLVDCHAVICLKERDGESKRIAPGSPWHMGHTADRTGWTGPEHQRCGSSDGARRGNQDRPRHIAATVPGRDTVCKACGKPYHYAAKQCIICGRHYHPSRGVQYTCSRPCGVAYKRLGGYAPKPLPACEVCGASCRSYGSRTCSEACREAQRKELTCQRCGKKFQGRTARYCSGNCNALAYYYAHREEIIDSQLARYYERQGRQPPVRTAPPRRNDGSSQRTVKRRSGATCVWCGKTVWRSEVNQVDGGWGCAPCRRRMTAADPREELASVMVTARQSRAW